MMNESLQTIPPLYGLVAIELQEEFAEAHEVVCPTHQDVQYLGLAAAFENNFSFSTLQLPVCRIEHNATNCYGRTRYCANDHTHGSSPFNGD